MGKILLNANPGVQAGVKGLQDGAYLTQSEAAKGVGMSDQTFSRALKKLAARLEGKYVKVGNQ